jgi:hypothetical protein
MSILWNPELVSQYGANVYLFGYIGCGKTTLLKTLVNYLQQNAVKIGDGDHCRGYNTPFPMNVHATKDILYDQKYGWTDIPFIHRKMVPMTAKRFPYFREGCTNALTILEDLPTMITTGQTVQEPLNNFLSGIRHRNSVFFLSAQALSDYLEILSPAVRAKMTHLVAFSTGESLLRLRKFGIPSGVARFLDNRLRMVNKYEYIVIDVREKIVTKPFSNKNVEPLLRMLKRQNLADEIEDFQYLWIPKPYRPKEDKKILTPSCLKVEEELKKNPKQDLNDLAIKLGITRKTLYKNINYLKANNRLDKNVRYGKGHRW